MKMWTGILMLAVGSAASAQQPRVSTDATAAFIAGEPAIGTIVRGEPYSAEATTTVTQVLADGTRIERTTMTRLFRDGEGRMRREQTVIGLGALSPSDGAVALVTIADPVAGMSYVLEAGARRARRTPFSSPETRPRPRSSQPPPPPPPPAGARTQQSAGMPPPPAPPPPPSIEPLGVRQIESVEAKGVRMRVVIEAGRIGNDRPIEILDERWESPALGVLVQSRHSDPRTGVVEYRLTNIVRVEPSHDLFVVPPDYTIVEARNDERR